MKMSTSLLPTNRKGSGTIKIELPYHGTAAGINYEVRGIESKELSCICNRKITIDQVRLLEDGSNAAFSKTVQQLSGTKIDGNKYPPALDPLKGKAFFCEDELFVTSYLFLYTDYH